MKYKDITIYSYLRYYRVSAGLTQKQLADEVGCSLYMIQLLESDNNINPSMKLAYGISDALHKHGVYWSPTIIFKDFKPY